MSAPLKVGEYPLDDELESLIWSVRRAKSGNNYGMLLIRLSNGLDIELMIDRAWAAVIDMTLQQKQAE